MSEITVPSQAPNLEIFWKTFHCKSKQHYAKFDSKHGNLPKTIYPDAKTITLVLKSVLIKALFKVFKDAKNFQIIFFYI